MLTLDGRRLGFGRPDHATAAGVGYVSGDRKREGLIPALSVWRNITLVKEHELGVAEFLNPVAERRQGVELLSRFRVLAASPNQEVVTLSGGNQQSPSRAVGGDEAEVAHPRRTNSRR